MTVTSSLLQQSCIPARYGLQAMEYSTALALEHGTAAPPCASTTSSGGAALPDADCGVEMRPLPDMPASAPFWSSGARPANTAVLELAHTTGRHSPAVPYHGRRNAGLVGTRQPKPSASDDASAREGHRGATSALCICAGVDPEYTLCPIMVAEPGNVLVRDGGLHRLLRVPWCA